MDKEKLALYVGGFVLWFVGWSLTNLIVRYFYDFPPSDIQYGLVAGLGGLLGGVISKKWWGALVGGFILSVLSIGHQMFLFWLVM